MATFGANLETRRSKGVGGDNSHHMEGVILLYNSLFAGVFPRMFGIGLGGFIFFGAYEKSRKVFSHYLQLE